MDPADQTKLVHFLNAGESLYIEGDFGYFVKNTPFYALLGCIYLDGGDSTASVSSFSGQPAGIVSGKNYTYLPTNWYWYLTRYIDELGSNGSKMIFNCNFDKNRAATYEGKNGAYKVIYSAFVFMGLRGKDAKNDLMKRYMDYLLGNTPVVQEQRLPGSTKPMLQYRNSNRSVYFTLNTPAHVELNLFTVTGRFVSRVSDGTLSAGDHCIFLNAQLLGSGAYLLDFKTEEGTNNSVLSVSK